MDLRPAREALTKALFAQFKQVFVAVGPTLGELEAGQMIVAELKVEIAFFRDEDGVVRGLGVAGEEPSHFLLALEIQLAGLEAHAVRVVHGLAHLYAHEDVLIIGVFFFNIVRVVREREGYAGLVVEPYYPGGGLFLLAQAVILYLEIEILAEQLAQLKSLRTRPAVVVVKYPLRDIARHAAAQAHEALGVLMQQLPVDTGLDVKALGEGAAHQIAEVAVALLVLAEEYEMCVFVVQPVLLVRHAPRRDVDLAADDGLYARGAAGLVERHRAVHHAVVGDGESRLSQRLGGPGELVYTARPVEQGVFGMHMQVNKCHLLISSYLAGRRPGVSFRDLRSARLSFSAGG